MNDGRVVVIDGGAQTGRESRFTTREFLGHGALAGGRRPPTGRPGRRGRR
jgi:hypothetical protein